MYELLTIESLQPLQFSALPGFSP
ncbi:hypothetical protein LCGC14_3113310, partial [marine sediment metagenome]